MKDKKDKIYYFQEKSNDILDLQDELTIEEIGIYFILKAGYFKYAGELKKENANQRCKFYGDINKFNAMISKLFDEVEGLLVNNSWLSEINGIKEVSKKRSENAKSRWDNTKEPKPKPTTEKPKETQRISKETNPIYKKLSDGLLFVLEAKLQRKLSSRNWEDEIKKLIEKDLSVRQNPIEDVKHAIQTIANNYGKEYFPVIQSAKSLREKFTKIEEYVKRNSQSKNNQSSALDQYNSILNDLNGGFNE